MMPMTPSGTRIRPTLMPLGRWTRSVISLIGSVRRATCSTPSAIASTDLSVTARRSTNAASSPDARARATSCALISTSFARSRRIAAATAASAPFLVAVSARAIARDASRARRPIWCMELRMSIIEESRTSAMIHPARAPCAPDPVARRACWGSGEPQPEAQQLVPGVAFRETLDDPVDRRGVTERGFQRRSGRAPRRRPDEALARFAPDPRLAENVGRVAAFGEPALHARDRAHVLRHHPQHARRRLALAGEAVQDARKPRLVAAEHRLRKLRDLEPRDVEDRVANLLERELALGMEQPELLDLLVG